MSAFGPAFFAQITGHVRDLKGKVPVRVSRGADCDKPLLRVQWGFSCFGLRLFNAASVRATIITCIYAADASGAPNDCGGNLMAKEKIVVEGGTPLAGEVHISGAKNSALKLIAAALLGQARAPFITCLLFPDIVVMSKVIETLGGQRSPRCHTLHVDTAGVDTWETPYELVSKMRASISVLGPLVARFGKARVAMPGRLQLGRS